MTAWITTVLIIIILLAILYAIFKKCQNVSSLPRVCFPLYPFSTILRGTARTDIFVEIVNLASAEAMWVHFASMAVHPSQLQITGYPRAYDMHIIKLCCCRQLQVDWQNIILCDLDRNIIKLPTIGKISIWSTNDLESIETNIPYQIRVYGRVLDLVISLEIKDDVNIIDHKKQLDNPPSPAGSQITTGYHPTATPPPLTNTQPPSTHNNQLFHNLFENNQPRTSTMIQTPYMGTSPAASSRLSRKELIASYLL